MKIDYSLLFLSNTNVSSAKIEQMHMMVRCGYTGLDIYKYGSSITHPWMQPISSRNCQLTQSAFTQHVDAHCDIVVASGYGLRSPGHLPCRFSFSFQGDDGQGGICNVCCCVLLFAGAVAEALLTVSPNINFIKGNKNTEHTANTTMTTISLPIGVRWCFLSLPLWSTSFVDDEGAALEDVDPNRFIMPLINADVPRYFASTFACKCYLLDKFTSGLPTHWCRTMCYQSKERWWLFSVC